MLPEWDFEANKDKYPLLLHVPYFELYRRQVIKQADLELAMCMYGSVFAADDKARNVDYYEQRTVRDSSLSANVQAVICAEVGHLELAYDYASEAAFIDLHDIHHNTRDGLHMASLAGAWVSLVVGFGGARDEGGTLRFTPRLPDAISRLCFNLRWHGLKVKVDFTPTEATYSLRDGADGVLTFYHEGNEVTVHAGDVGHATDHPITPLLARPKQPLGPRAGSQRFGRSDRRHDHVSDLTNAEIVRPTHDGRRMTGSTRRSTAIASYTFAAVMLSTTIPTPLYAIYASRLHLKPFLITLIFAAYAVGVIAALMLFGRVSDQIGRKPVLFVAAGFSLLSAAVFVTSGSLPALFTGRVLSGIAAGLVTGAATAYISELHSDRARGSLLATVSNMAGLGLGPLVSGLLAQHAPQPTRLPFIVGAALLLPALLLLIAPDTVNRSPRRSSSSDQAATSRRPAGNQGAVHLCCHRGFRRVRNARIHHRAGRKFPFARTRRPQPPNCGRRGIPRVRGRYRGPTQCRQAQQPNGLAHRTRRVADRSRSRDTRPSREVAGTVPRRRDDRRRRVRLRHPVCGAARQPHRTTGPPRRSALDVLRYLLCRYHRAGDRRRHPDHLDHPCSPQRSR